MYINYRTKDDSIQYFLDKDIFNYSKLEFKKKQVVDSSLRILEHLNFDDKELNYYYNYRLEFFKEFYLVNSNIYIDTQKYKKQLLAKIMDFYNTQSYSKVVFDLDSCFFFDHYHRVKENFASVMYYDKLNAIFLATHFDSIKNVNMLLIPNKSCSNLMYLLQHSNSELRLTYLSLIEKCYKNNKITNQSYACFMDRFYLDQYGQQLYGTQLEPQNGKFVLCKVFDMKNLKARRDYLQLIPIDNYISKFNNN